ncbi:hypothetical protein [Rhodopila sp.]|uniref:hypothetical protein n=1 Tax=Rhodopila sp. TaxID=2480087 RepID=UPI003D1457CB
MVVLLRPTNSNSGLAAAVNNRIRADGSMIAAKSAMWRLVGVGALCLMAGCGIGAALFGYAYVADSRSSAEKMATAFAAALDHANLGTVRLNPESVVKLDPNATVKVDPNAALKVDASAVHMTADLPHPSERQYTGGSNARVVTDYTIFKTVEFGAGTVITGWNFTSSEQDRPNSQFCYYAAPSVDGVISVRIELAKEGQYLPIAQNNSANVDTAAAVQKCIWFR